MIRIGLSLAAMTLATLAAAQQPTDLRTGEEDFAADFYRRAAADEGNLVVSPWSLRLALAMTRPGARGETAAELDRVLRLPADQAHLGPLFAAVNSGLRERAKSGDETHFQFEVVNRLWPERSERMREEYLRILKQDWAAPATPLDFRGDPEAARRTINEAVAEATHDLVPELLKKEDVDKATRLVLTNALWLKAAWSEPFTGRTRAAPFFAGEKETRVGMMRGAKWMRFAETEAAAIGALPLAGDELEFVILLPKERDGLAAIERELDGKTLRAWLARLDGARAQVDLSLPRFKIRWQKSIRELVNDMGLKVAMSAMADFSDMADPRGLFISDVIQGACLDVDEKGLEAAAATAVIMKRGGLRPRDLPTMVCDHPFLWLIRDRVSGTVLFAGRLSDPPAFEGEGTKTR
ncbi:MAG: serpin family protein [Planctomycetota bacterium]